ncbi:ornithine carbamoyltransferase [Thermoactinomyces daqus]|uniref:Ornithine carbamoyltransferase n=1 Tax=Thermoactinomyces daqus TaxID=1329516 RepID=A0A7W2AHE9_9BACL|nr:ornithine carbamoyltransferase [Thermoactinomyces daqus]MBA4541768.1 ornithine carbamoyltransferase [Thermoactinomyces daqus]
MSFALKKDPLARLKGQDFLSLLDWSPDEVSELLKLTQNVKKNKEAWLEQAPLKGKGIAMIFDKPSTRTRVSFEAAVHGLGGFTLQLRQDELQLGRGESVEDTARILSGYVDAVVIRTFSHEMVEQLAEAASIPVINALTDRFHPCQAVADAFTLFEQKGKCSGVKLAYIGDGNNVLHSLMMVSALTGMHLSVSTPAGYEPDTAIWQKAEEIARSTGGTLSFHSDPASAVKEADAVYTDVWASMGQEEEKELRAEVFAGYQVNEQLMAQAKNDAVFMHCLPAYRGLEVTEAVIDGPASVVFRQAENRLHAQKALLIALLGNA